MTRLPSGGPNLEFNFFWADIEEEEAFGRLVQALVDMGACFRRGGILRRIVSADHGNSPTDAIQDVDIGGMEDVESYLTDPIWRLSAVYMEGATNTTRGVAEVVCYGTIMPDAALHDHSPLSIYTEGRWTETWIGEPRKRERHARTIGRRAKDRFCAIVVATRPSYASITIEDTLPTPWELRHKPDCGVFRNFYIDSCFVGGDAVNDLHNLFADAYSEPIGSGLYISTWAYFNRKGLSIPITEVYDRSINVSRMIARAPHV